MARHRELVAADGAIEFAPPIDRSTTRLVTGGRADTSVAADPLSLRAATSLYQARRHPAVIASDAVVAFGGGLIACRSIKVAAVCALALVVTGLALGIWKRRSSPETQGIVWFFRPLLPAALASGAITAATVEKGDQAALAALGASLALLVIRAGLWAVISSARRHGLGLQPTLVVGPPSSISGVQHRLKTFPETGLRFEGSYSPRPSDFATPQSRQALVDRLAMSPRVKHVLCLVQDVDEPVFKDLVRFADSNVEVSVVLPLARLFAAHTRSHLGDLGLLPIHFRASWGSSAAKRAVDIVGSLILIALLSPVLLATAIAIRTGDPGPAIFRQRRVGKDGQTFTIFKFRSMVVDAEARRDDYMARNVNRGLLFKVENDPRVTPVGAIIRRLSIDELPQLFNVFQGDMSLVGPRPLPVDPDDFDVAAQIRHRVLPGITGLWQIKGANALSYSDMLDLDLTYVATHSFGVDLVILLRTIPAVLIRRAPY